MGQSARRCLGIALSFGMIILGAAAYAADEPTAGAPSADAASSPAAAQPAAPVAPPAANTVSDVVVEQLEQDEVQEDLVADQNHALYTQLAQVDQDLHKQLQLEPTLAVQQQIQQDLVQIQRLYPQFLQSYQQLSNLGQATDQLQEELAPAGEPQDVE